MGLCQLEINRQRLPMKARFTPKYIFYSVLGHEFPAGVEEYKFHPTRKWKFDYAVPEFKIAFEYEGGVYSKGQGHLSATVYSKNCEKYNAAALLGWSVYRFTNPMIGIASEFYDVIDAIKKGREV